MDGTSKVRKLLLQVDLKVERLLHDVESSLKINKPDTIGIRLPKAAFTRIRFQSKMNTLLSVLASCLHKNDENAYPK